MSQMSIKHHSTLTQDTKMKSLSGGALEIENVW